MAPEIIENKGYSVYVDLWALGILLYNMRCGEFPIGEDIDDPYEIYKEIL